MFVGEAPGRDEDIEGLPFVGRSGKLLDRMIAAIGLDRSRAYIANVIPWRPPGNRTPTPQETQICLPFIQRQIELVNPDVLVTLGNPSTQTLLGTREGIMRTRGKWFEYDTGTARSARCRPSIRPICCARRPTSGCRGRICARSRRCWQSSLRRRGQRRASDVPTIHPTSRLDIGHASLCLRYDPTIDCRAYGPFGRTMAQPIRNSGCRPFTSHSKERGTSGHDAGKALR